MVGSKTINGAGNVHAPTWPMTVTFQQKALDNFAVHAAAKHLGLKGKPEQLNLLIVHQDIRTLYGTSVTLCLSTPSNSMKIFNIQGAFPARNCLF